MEETGEENKVPSKSRQLNGVTRGEPPVRRSWRPCQMLNQDGEPNPHHHNQHHHHHHHYPSSGRGPPRHRRRPPSGQGHGQSQGQSPSLAQAIVSSRQEGGENQGTETGPVLQRPAVTRYRRHGDPNPRLRGHRQRQPIRVMQESCVDEKEGEAEAEVQQCSLGDSETHQLQDSPHQSPVAVVTPTHFSSAHNAQLHTQDTPATAPEEDLQDHRVESEEDLEEVKKNYTKEQLAEDDGDQHLTIGPSSCMDNTQKDGRTNTEGAQGDQQDVMKDVVEDTAQESEITDLCSDTESAASLSMDGPLHSPPPLQSPTPPSSPDVPPFPQLDHFSEDTSMSPLPDNDLPEDEDDDDCSQSCSLSYSTSCSESYPKTYADFYTESHPKSYAEPVYNSCSEPKSHPNSFPEPLKPFYPEMHRESRRQPSRRTEPIEAQQESCQGAVTSHRRENSQKGHLASPTKDCHHVQRHGRDHGSRHSPLDRSVGCRLHHYDGQSDGEVGSADQSPVPRSRSNTVGPQGEEGTKGSGDAISLAIKDIKEAIEEVKIKTVRSPYTPDHPGEPIWVMRQEVSPTEDVYPLQTTADHVSIVNSAAFQPV